MITACLHVDIFSPLYVFLFMTVNVIVSRVVNRTVDKVCKCENRGGSLFNQVIPFSFRTTYSVFPFEYKIDRTCFLLHFTAPRTDFNQINSDIIASPISDNFWSVTTAPEEWIVKWYFSGWKWFKSTFLQHYLFRILWCSFETGIVIFNFLLNAIHGAMEQRRWDSDPMNEWMNGGKVHYYFRSFVMDDGRAVGRCHSLVPARIAHSMCSWKRNVIKRSHGVV